MLLDEADVFLEQRTMNGPKESTDVLVSLFFWVIKYYKGIMVLTLNRGGINDVRRSFQVPVQLALRYENLSKAERTKVWMKFLSRLKLIGEVNVERATDSRGHNAIPKTRQLAHFKKKPMTWGQLRNVIKVAEKFDNLSRRGS